MKEKIVEWVNKAKLYLSEVWMEVNPKTGKVSWPDRKMIMGSTVVVLICISILSLYIFLVDIISVTVIEKIVGRR